MSGDVEPGAAPVLVWFELQRRAEGVRFVPHLIDDRSGVSVQIQVVVVDVKGGGRFDILTASKLSSFVFVQRAPAVK